MRERFFFKSAGSAAGAASVTVVPGADAILVDGLLADVVVAAGVAAEPGTDTIEVTGLDPVLTLGLQLLPGTDTIEVTGLQPTAVIGQVLEPGTDTIEVTGLQAEWSTSVGVTEVPGTDTIEVTGLLVDEDIGVGETAGTDTIEVTGLQAEWSTSVGVTEVPGTDTIEVTGLLVDEDIGVGETAGTDTIEVTGLQPTVVTANPGVEATPGTDTIEVTGLQPTVDIGVAAEAEGGAGVVALLDAGGEVTTGPSSPTVTQLQPSYFGFEGESGTVDVDFNPNNIKSLVGWWDASDRSTVIDRTTGIAVISGAARKVQQWNDKKGSNDLVSAASGNDPSWADEATYDVDVINELGTVTFNGTDEYLRCLTPDAALNNKQEWHIFAVVKDGSGGFFWGLETTGGSREHSLTAGVPFGTSDVFYTWDGSAWIGASNGSEPAGAHWMAGAVEDYGTQLRVRVWNDGGLTTGTAFPDHGTNSADTISMGCRINPGTSAFESYFEGGVGEVCVFTRILTTNERAAMIAYFQEKWGVA